MTVTYRPTLRTARMQAVVDDIGAGGKLKLLTAADAVLCTIPLAAPAGVVAGDTLALSDANGGSSGILSGTGSAAGEAAWAIITNAANVTIIAGLTVGTSGTDVVLDNTNIALGQAVTITVGSFNHY